MGPASPSPNKEDQVAVALGAACRTSTAEWQLHLEQLFNNARDRFADVIWELLSEGDALPIDEVWGHKAMVYARAPPTFQARYFSFRPPPVASPSPYGPSPMPAQSAVSLSAISLGIDAPSPARSPSPNGNALRSLSPAPSIGPGQVMRLTTTIASALFSQELEFLYTGKSFGDAFEFLFDSPEKRDEGDGEKNRLEKLRKDLVFMWRSRLYSDVRLQLAGNLSSSATHDDPTATAVFSSHRFILVSRSPYFRTQLLGPFVAPAPPPGQPFTLTLPSPPFTPASLHFTLGYIYTGTLSFSHRTYDLDTAFHIMRAATYLVMPSLYAEIEARIIEEMMHGLFHAYISFDEYEKLTGGKWGASGDKCRQCARRAPRVLEFAVLEDVKNDRLANGARRALVGLFGDGWCTPEFAVLPQKTRDSLLRGVQKRTVPLNVFPLLYAAQHAITRLNSVMDAWAHAVREMVLGARKAIDELMCDRAEECFEQPEWLSVLDADGGRFEDGEKVEWVMDCLRRGLNEKNAGIVYQTIVSLILLRPHPQDPNATALSNTSGIRQQVEVARMDIIKWMRRRWAGVHIEGGFDNLEGWALKELSHELEVPVEDLLRPSPSSPAKGPPTRTGLRPALCKPEGDGDTASMTSLRVGVLNRGKTRLGGASHDTLALSRDTLASSASSIRSVRTTASTASRASAVARTRTPALSLSSQSQAPLRSPSRASRASRASLASRPAPSTASTRKSIAHSERPKSVTSSVRSHTSTIRKTSILLGQSNTHAGRPDSTMSTRSDASTAFKTARSEVITSRASVASTTTTSHGAVAESSKAPIPRARRSSTASMASIVSSVASTGSRAVKKTEKTKLAAPPMPERSASTTSNGSGVSKTKRVAAAKAAAAKANERRESIGRLPASAAPRKNGVALQGAVTAPAFVKGKGKATPSAKNKEFATPVLSSASEVSTLNAKDVKGVLRKESTDTVITNSTTTATTDTGTTTTTPSTPRPPKPVRAPPKVPDSPSLRLPQNLGATLNVGIPCIISSKRSRFRAFARYIGELEGQPGSWVGVEVPVGEGWSADKLEGRPWNDGTWGGRRYFEIGTGADWDEGEERRKRIREGSGSVSRHPTLKREGEQLIIDRSKRLRSLSPAASDASATAELRGLFVRPQQVIYVVDAESDL